MKKNILYSLIALMGLFTACKTGPEVAKPVDPIASADPYKHSRPIALTSDDGALYKYTYNATNQVVKLEYFTKDNSGIKLFSSQTYTYTNGKVTQVILENSSLVKYITDYKYQGNTDIIESTIFNGIDYTNPMKPIITGTINTDFSYVGEKISKITAKDGNNIPFNIRNYTFSLKGENPFVTVGYVPQSVNGIPANPPFNATTEYYKDVIDPVSYFFTSSTSESKFLPKSGAVSSNANSTYTQTYELDNVGRIKTVSAMYPTGTIKSTYTYETY